MSVNLRRRFLAVLLAGVGALVLATCVFVEFAGVRIRLLKQAVAVAQTGSVRLTVTDERARDLRPPFAVIARIHNDSAARRHFLIRTEQGTVCRVTVPPRSAGRVDCAMVQAWDPSIELVVESEVVAPWSLEYLEVATHHGRSSAPLEALFLPADSGNYRRPSRGWVVASWMAFTGVLLLPAPLMRWRPAKVGYRLALGAMATLFAIVLLAPLLSPFRVVLSVGTFAGWVSLPLLPRLSLAVWSRRRALARLVRSVARSVWRFFFGEDWRVACVLSAAVVALGLVYGARVAGGSDEYGYVSEADLWLRNRLKTDQSFASEVPWPRGQWTFSPYGYRPHPIERDVIVPVYSPGLPLMMAAAKFVGGQDAMFSVVPLCGGLFVLATFGVGRRIASGIAPVAGAWLIATSPVVLAQSVATMTDIPVAAAWTGALYLLLGTGAASALGAGFLVAVALVIRPNLFPLAAVCALLYLFRLFTTTERRRSISHLLLFGAGALPGVMVVAVVNQYLYGSALTSGYGTLSEFYDWGRTPENVRRYLYWMVEAHTPVVLIGLFAILMPLRQLWPAARERGVLLVIRTFIVVLWAIYGAWVVFDSWWFLRFLLPSWPFIMLGVGAVAEALCRLPFAWGKRLVVLCLLALGLAQLNFAWQRGVLVLGPGSRRYAVAARLTKQATTANSVVISLTHGGSIRYYGERVTMNASQMEEGTLDQTVEWLQERGVPTYLTLEDWEVKEFRQRFAGARRLAALDRPPRAVFENPGRVVVFELSDIGPPVMEPIVAKGLDIGWRAVPPGSPPTLRLGRTP